MIRSICGEESNKKSKMIAALMRKDVINMFF